MTADLTTITADHTTAQENRPMTDTTATDLTTDLAAALPTTALAVPHPADLAADLAAALTDGRPMADRVARNRAAAAERRAVAAADRQARADLRRLTATADADAVADALAAHLAAGADLTTALARASLDNGSSARATAERADRRRTLRERAAADATADARETRADTLARVAEQVVPGGAAVVNLTLAARAARLADLEADATADRRQVVPLAADLADAARAAARCGHLAAADAAADARAALAAATLRPGGQGMAERWQVAHTADTAAERAADLAADLAAIVAVPLAERAAWPDRAERAAARAAAGRLAALTTAARVARQVVAERAAGGRPAITGTDYDRRQVVAATRDARADAVRAAAGTLAPWRADRAERAAAALAALAADGRWQKPDHDAARCQRVGCWRCASTRRAAALAVARSGALGGRATMADALAATARGPLARSAVVREKSVPRAIHLLAETSVLCSLDRTRSHLAASVGGGMAADRHYLAATERAATCGPLALAALAAADRATLPTAGRRGLATAWQDLADASGGVTLADLARADLAAVARSAADREDRRAADAGRAATACHVRWRAAASATLAAERHLAAVVVALTAADATATADDTAARRAATAALRAVRAAELEERLAADAVDRADRAAAAAHRTADRADAVADALRATAATAATAWRASGQRWPRGTLAALRATTAGALASVADLPPDRVRELAERADLAAADLATAWQVVDHRRTAAETRAARAAAAAERVDHRRRAAERAERARVALTAAERARVADAADLARITPQIRRPAWPLAAYWQGRRLAAAGVAVALA